MRHIENQTLPTREGYKTKKADVIIYEGLTDFADTCAPFETFYVNRQTAGWHGRPSEDAFTALRQGDEAMVAPSDEILSKIEARADFRSSDFEQVNMVAGGVPNVGAYLAGSPLNMRMRRRVFSQGAPIAIVVDLTVSADVDDETIRGRGAAALALVRVLSASRPVSLFVSVAIKPYGGESAGKSSIQIIPVDTMPLDLARAAFALGDPAMLRQFGFAGACCIPKGNASTGNIHWAFRDHHWAQENVPQEVARIMGCPDFVAVPAVYSGTSMRDPDTAADWVMDQAHRLSQSVAA